MRIYWCHLSVVALLFVAADVARGSPQAPATSKPPAATPAAQAEAVFGREELDQMMAPLALYPDSLLAQVLMASTYPANVADAVKWSKAHPDAKGEEAVRQVANEPWDPSVQSLVAFPQLLAVLGQDPAWVQKVGDAFLGQPEAVMDSVQRLRRQAQAAGNLKSNEQQNVTTQAPAVGATTTVVEPAAQTIIIEPADPEVVYVPSYDSSVVYGSWAYPAYPPYYYPPPAYYYPGGALLSFGIGVAIGGALWGDCDWGGGDIDIDVDRYNNFNSNRQIDRSQNKFRHNAANRDGVPYRDRGSREQYGRQLDGAAQRDSFRGHDQARTADRERARQSMQQRGFETPATTNREARARAGQASQQMGQQRNAQARQGARQQYSGSQGAQRNNAFTGASNPGQSRASSSRGRSSYSASQRSGSRGGGHQMSRPARGGGGRRR